MRPDGVLSSRLLRYGASLAAVLLASFLLVAVADRINPITVAMAFLLIVLASATFFGRNPALLASFAAMLCFNYFFLPPVGTWHIAEPQNLIAWAAFTVTAIMAGELSHYARRRAREAERLYGELQSAFEATTQAEALKQSEKLKSALLDAVTHDLRTPLTSIKASVTTLLDSEGGQRTIELDSEGRTEFLSIINEETDRLNGFIEGMVALARVEAGTASAASNTTVDEILTAAVERARALTAGHVLEVHSDPALAVRADARAIAEVIYNLVENAVKYSPPGSTITLAARGVNDKVEFAVIDQGPGIAEHMRERVFEKFVRLGEGPASGLGLGLSIARGIVEAQHGSIRIEGGDDGRGTRVVITLPAGRS